MATGPMGELIHQLRRTALLGDGAGLTDGQLLEEYISSRGEAALAALVQRHGPMVWGVCRRILGNYHDAEDAFQATFLVLVRKAMSVRPREMVANWLYGVAHQTALKARATVSTRRGRERQVEEMPEPAVAEPARWDELLPVLDEELSRLPDKYRAVVVLCDLEGKTRKEAARQLGVPEGTVAGWVARARVMLANRLTQRGVTLSGGALAAVLSHNMASAGVPAVLASNTIMAASLVAAGQAATGAIPVEVAALTERVVKAMLFTKLRAAVAVVMMLGFVAAGATVLICRTAAGQDDKKPTAEKTVNPAAKQEKGKDKEVVTAWGKEVGGLQAGLGTRPGERRAYHHGETVKLVVRVRNVGKETVKFEYIRQFLDENPPTVTDADGETVRQHGTSVTGLIHFPVQVTLEPGKEIELESRIHGASGRRYELRPASGGGKPMTEGWPLFVGTGKVSLQYERVFGDSSIGRIKLDPTLSKLATGKLELEIKSDLPPAAAEKK